MRIFLIALLAMLPAAPCLAQLAGEDKALAERTLESFSEQITTMYFDEKTAQKAAKRLATKRADYLAAENLEAFAERVTADIQDNTGDLHLALYYSPKEVTAARKHEGGGHEDESGNHGAEEKAAGHNADGHDVVRVEEHEEGEHQTTIVESDETDIVVIKKAGKESRATPAREGGYGLRAVKELTGLVGYMRIDHFDSNVDFAIETIGGALDYLDGYRAIIIDLRYNIGGAPEAAHYLVGRFVGPGKHIADFIERGGKTTKQSTPSHLDGAVLNNRQIYVLTGPLTFSAGEAVAEQLRIFAGAKIYGAKTLGGGNFVRSEILNEDFIGDVPVARVEIAGTGKSWEGVGVTPDVAVDFGATEASALMAAIDEMAAGENDEEKVRMYEYARAEARSMLNPIVLPPSLLSRFAGDYENAKAVFRDGMLYIELDGRPESMLTPIGPSRFRYENAVFVHVEFDSEGLNVLFGGGAVERKARLK